MKAAKFGAVLASSPLLIVALAAFTRRSVEEPTITVARAGCDITIQAHNNDNSSVTIDLEGSEVKVKNGLWSKLKQGGTWVVNSGGAHESKVVSLDLGCDFDRQYKFLMRSGSNEKYIYHPDGNSFTQSKTLILGDVGTHF